MFRLQGFIMVKFVCLQLFLVYFGMVDMRKCHVPRLHSCSCDTDDFYVYLFCDVFPRLEHETFETAQTFSIYVMDTIIGDVYYQPEIWPVLKELYTPSMHTMICFNGVCKQKIDGEVDTTKQKNDGEFDTTKQENDGEVDTTTYAHSTRGMWLQTISNTANLMYSPTAEENIQTSTQNVAAVKTTPLIELFAGFAATTPPAEINSENTIGANVETETTSSMEINSENTIGANVETETISSTEINSENSIVKQETTHITEIFTLKTQPPRVELPPTPMEINSQLLIAKQKTTSLTEIFTTPQNLITKVGGIPEKKPPSTEISTENVNVKMNSGNYNNLTNETNCEIVRNVVFPAITQIIPEGYLVVTIFILAVLVIFLLIIVVIICLKKRPTTQENPIEMIEMEQQPRMGEIDNEVEGVHQQHQQLAAEIELD